MSKKVNIIKIIGMLMLALALVFTLSGCSEGEALQSDKSDDEMANEHLDCWQKEILTLLYDTMVAATAELLRYFYANVSVSKYNIL